MSTATQSAFVKDAWQTPRNARTLRAFMALKNQEIGQRIAQLRAAKGNPPQTTVAAALGVGERTYQTWESGEAKPGYRNLQALARYFEVGEDYILTGAVMSEAPAADPQLDRIEAKIDQLADYAERIETLIDALADEKGMERMVARFSEALAQTDDQAAARPRPRAPRKRQAPATRG